MGLKELFLALTIPSTYSSLGHGEGKWIKLESGISFLVLLGLLQVRMFTVSLVSPHQDLLANLSAMMKI